MRLADRAEIRATGDNIGLARDQHEADLAIIRVVMRALARLQLMEVEADIGPAGGLRRDVDGPAGRAGGANDQIGFSSIGGLPQYFQPASAINRSRLS